MKTKVLLTLALAALTIGLAEANNIEVTNITLIDQNVATRTTTIQFDLSWENSWRISSGLATGTRPGYSRSFASAGATGSTRG